MKTITFRIRPGKPTIIEVDGVADKSCHDITAGFERALGTVTSVQEKPDTLVNVDQIKLYQR
tara:strand:- start:9812 stop:9997 length:186 start_codon:yes stop_codon:yes gene_type:complete